MLFIVCLSGFHGKSVLQIAVKGPHFIYLFFAWRSSLLEEKPIASCWCRLHNHKADGGSKDWLARFNFPKPTGSSRQGQVHPKVSVATQHSFPKPHSPMGCLLPPPPFAGGDANIPSLFIRWPHEQRRGQLPHYQGARLGGVLYMFLPILVSCPHYLFFLPFMPKCFLGGRVGWKICLAAGSGSLARSQPPLSYIIESIKEF